MPRTSVKIWQRSAPSVAARATAVVSLPPRPSVVISLARRCSGPGTRRRSRPCPPRARRGPGAARCRRCGPGRSWPSVVMPACGPVRLIAGMPRPWRAIESRVAAWCSPVASRTSSSRGSGSSVIAAARPSSSSVVSPIAETDHDQVAAGGALAGDPARDPLDAVGVGHGGAAVLLDDEGGRHRGAFYRPARRAPGARHGRGLRWRGRPRPRRCPPCASISTATRRSQPIAGGALDSRGPSLDRGRPQPLRGVPGAGRGARRRGRRDPARTSAASIRTTRSSPCGSRSTGSTRWPSTGSAGPRPEPRGEDVRPHAARRRRRPGAGSPPTSRPRPRYLRSPDGDRPGRRARSSRSGSAWAAGCRSWPRPWGSTSRA